MTTGSSQSNSLILGLDIGTQAVKGVLVRLNGQVIAQAGLERGPSHPHPGWVEMDAERDWWGAGLQVVSELLDKLDVAPDAIAAVGVSGLVPCLCPVDIDGNPLRPAILYSDNRALAELDWVNHQADLSLWAEAVVPKLVWVQRHEPEVFAQTHVVLSGHNYFIYRLTGSFSMDFDTAGIMGGVFDPVNKSWRADLCEKLGLPAGVWPPLFAATDVVGRVTAEAAQATGLAEGTPVIGGSGDTFPTIVGCGAVEVGDAMVSFGTTGLLTIANRPLADSSAGPHFSSPEKGASVTWGANVLSAGRLVRWFRDQFSDAERAVAARMGEDEFTLLEAEAGRIPPGAEGLVILPHWLGRRTPTPSATLRGAMLGLNPSHTTAHIYRALLESFAYNIRQGYEIHRDQVQRLVVTAGGARSPLWRQIMADMLNTELEYHPSASGSLGIAFQAAYALGLVEEYTDIKNRWLSDALRIMPDPAAVQVYDRLFPVYCAFDEAVAEPFRQLSEALRGEAVK